ncbi:MAG: Uma2 family endonuclease [Candidatus Firestonebacteria bacterium]|nr:Uma2 family endonuclease [Candidatus Firestonebacteria bacterium]
MFNKEMNINPNSILQIHRFTINEYYHLAKAGILQEDDNVELIEGRIIDMTPIGSKHASCVKRIMELLINRLQKKATIGVQDPIDLNEQTELEPDITILIKRADFYAEHHPRPEDVLLIIEVADSSLEYDKTVKIPLYAKANIQEVWLINLIENIIEIYRNPSQIGYKFYEKASKEDTIFPLCFPDINIKASEIVG